MPTLAELPEGFARRRRLHPIDRHNLDAGRGEQSVQRPYALRAVA